MEQVSYKFISNEKVQICIPLEGRLKLIDAETVVSQMETVVSFMTTMLFH